MDAFITRPEHERAFDRLEMRLDSSREEILNAVRDLKNTMNGQFVRQNEINDRHSAVLGRYGTDIEVLQDRGARDMTARWGAGIGALIATLAAFFGIKAG